MRRWVILLLVASLAGCSTPTKVIRLDTGQGKPSVHVPRRHTAPALAQVESVAITAEGVTLALAPNAVAMAARDSSNSSAVGRFRAGTYGELKNAGIKDAHHVIQDAAVRELPGYDSRAAPAVELKGPATRRTVS